MIKQNGKVNGSKSNIVVFKANQLTPVEKTELAKCEETIKKGWKIFLEVGKALIVIQTGRLYRETHKTFELYCQEKLGISKGSAYRFIDAAKVVSSLPIEDTKGLNEGQVRELGKAPAGQRKEVLDKTKATANKKGKKVTAKDIREEVNKKLGGGKAKIEARPEGNEKPTSHDLKSFQKKIMDIVEEFGRFKLGKVAMAIELEDRANKLREEFRKATNSKAAVVAAKHKTAKEAESKQVA